MYVQLEDKLYQQKEGMTMGNSLSPMSSNIFIKHHEEIAMDTAEHKPGKWLRYIYDNFVFWPHGPARLQKCLHYLSSLRPTIKFTIELKLMILIPSLTSWSRRGVLNWTRNCTGNLHIQVVICAPRAATHITWKWEAFIAWSVSQGHMSGSQGFQQANYEKSYDLMLNEYPQEIVDSIMKTSRSNRLSSDTIYQDTVIIRYVKGISEKFRRIGNRFNVRIIFQN
jgi:hypothetical protein